jgi:hypothetical protein
MGRNEAIPSTYFYSWSTINYAIVKSGYSSRIVLRAIVLRDFLNNDDFLERILGNVAESREPLTFEEIFSIGWSEEIDLHGEGHACALILYSSAG